MSPVGSADKGLANLRADRGRLDRIHRYLKGEHDAEYRLLARRSMSNWLPLLDSGAGAGRGGGTAAAMPGGDTSGAPAEWESWQANRMDARHTAVHRAALA